MTIINYNCDGNLFQVHTPNHAVSHEWPNGFPGADPVTFFPRAFAHLRTSIITDQVNVKVSNFYYLKDSEIVTFAGERVNLTSYIPTEVGKVRVVMLGLNTVYNIIQVIEGTEVDNNAYTKPPVTEIPENFIPSALVRLADNVTSINETDITDVRLFLGLPGGGGNTDLAMDDLSDVSALSPADQEGLIWDEANSYYTLARPLLADLMNGSFQETFDALVTSDGATITMSIEKKGGGDLTMQFSDGLTTLDCTPAAEITLTAGSIASPQKNFVYIPQSTKVLTLSTTGWPTSAEHIKVGFFFLQTAAYVQADGALVNQNWNDALMGSDNQGHLLHMAERSRRLGAIYTSGCAGNGTTGYVTITPGSPDTITVQVTSGVIFQMHQHNYTAKDTSSGDNFHVVNDSTGAYSQDTDLANYLLDSAGGSMSGDYYNLVLWAVANKGGEYSPLMINLPTGSYSLQANALNDIDGYDVYDIPAEFNTDSSTGFLLSRITLKHSPSGDGTWTWIAETDLRGKTPTTVSGGGSGSSLTEFADNVFSVYDNTDVTKEMMLDASGITTGNTRTLTVPDSDGTIALLSDVVDWPFDNILTVSATNTSADYATLPLAIAASSSGDMIQLDPGTYTLNNTLTIPAGVGINGGDYTQIIIELDSGSADDVAIDFGGDDCFLHGVTIKSLKASSTCMLNEGYRGHRFYLCRIYGDNEGIGFHNDSTLDFATDVEFHDCDFFCGFATSNVGIKTTTVSPNEVNVFRGAFENWDVEFAEGGGSSIRLFWPMTENNGTTGTPVGWVQDSLGASYYVGIDSLSSFAGTDTMIVHDASEPSSAFKGKVATLSNLQTYFQTGIDHGGLTGLTDDDHSQYLNEARHAVLDADVHSSGTATDGQVLTADGAGNSAWEDATGGGGLTNLDGGASDSIYLVTQNIDGGDSL